MAGVLVVPSMRGLPLVTYMVAAPVVTRMLDAHAMLDVCTMLDASTMSAVVAVVAVVAVRVSHSGAPVRRMRSVADERRGASGSGGRDTIARVAGENLHAVPPRAIGLAPSRGALKISPQMPPNFLHCIDHTLRMHTRLEAVTHAQRRGLIA